MWGKSNNYDMKVESNTLNWHINITWQSKNSVPIKIKQIRRKGRKNHIKLYYTTNDIIYSLTYQPTMYPSLQPLTHNLKMASKNQCTRKINAKNWGLIHYSADQYLITLTNNKLTDSKRKTQLIYKCNYRFSVSQRLQ
jgi:hypothetical protein